MANLHANMKGTIQSFCFIALLICLPGCSADESEAETGQTSVIEKPNIVVMLADDQAWFDSGAYGNKDLQTPNMDRLATEGLRFTNAFTGTAMCSPTRQMLYTGLYPVRSGAYPNSSVVKEGTQSIAHYMQALGYRAGLSGKQHIGPASSFPWEILGDEEAVRHTRIDFDAIDEFVNRDDDQPFLLIVTSHNPHYPWTEGDQSKYDPASISVPQHLVDTQETREALVAYYAEIDALDEEIGKVLSILDNAGKEDNTLFLYSSEHGHMFPFAKWTLYDAGIKTAMIARWPNQIEVGRETDAMVHYVDVTPTLVEAAGGETPKVEGESFLNVLLGESDEHRTHVYGIHTTRGINNWAYDYPIRAVRTHQFKLIMNLNAEKPFGNNVTAENRGGYYYSWEKSGDADALTKYKKYQHRPPVELYDVLADPFEQNNLAEKDRYQDVKNDLLKNLKGWIADQGDQGISTEKQARLHIRRQPDLEIRRNIPGK